MIVYRPLPAIKAISFDLDDTLYNNDHVIVKAEQALQTLLQANYPKAAALSVQQIKQIKRQLIDGNQDLRSDMGELRRLTLERMLNNDVDDPQLLQAAVQRCFNHFYTARSDFRIDENSCSLLIKLAKTVPLVAITNGNVDVSKIGLEGVFKFVLRASLQRKRKPFSDMFDETAQRLAVAPKHILHVGDNLKNDVYGAYKAGLSSAWLAVNRKMNLNNEPVRVLPNIQLLNLSELVAVATR